MDKLTPNDLMTFLWVAAALVAFVLAIWSLIDRIHKHNEPARELAQWQLETNTALLSDKKRLDSVEAGQKALCRGMLALLNHEITGNSVDKLKDAQNTITEFLINKG